MKNLKDFIEKYDKVVAMSRDEHFDGMENVSILCNFLNEYMPLPKNKYDIADWKDIIKRPAEWDYAGGDWVFGIRVDTTTIYRACTDLQDFVDRTFDMLKVNVVSRDRDFDFILDDEKEVVRIKLNRIIALDKDKRRIGNEAVVKKRDKDSYISRLAAINLDQEEYLKDELIGLLKALNLSEILTGNPMFKSLKLPDKAILELKKNFIGKTTIEDRNKSFSF